MKRPPFDNQRIDYVRTRCLDLHGILDSVDYRVRMCEQYRASWAKHRTPSIHVCVDFTLLGGPLSDSNSIIFVEADAGSISKRAMRQSLPLWRTAVDALLSILWCGLKIETN